jgi:hypothetical protein
MVEDLGLDKGDWELFSVNDNVKLEIKLSLYFKQYQSDIHIVELAVKNSFKNFKYFHIHFLKNTEYICIQ